MEKKKKPNKIKDEKLYKAIGFVPHKHQEGVLKMIDKEREILCRAGRRGGKSKLCSVAVIKTLLKGNTDVWIVAPTYNLSEIVFDSVLIDLAKILTPNEDFQVQRRTPQHIKIPSLNSALYVKSADNPVSLLGRSTDMIVMDEAAEIPEIIWQRYLYPTTSDRQGKIIYISTPKGRNWFYDKELELQEKGSAFHWWSKENPHFPKDEWERAKKVMTKKEFEQQYMAEYTNITDPVFGDVRRVIGDCLSKPKDGHLYVMGVDFGRRVDATAIIIIDLNSHKVAHYESLKDKEWEVQRGIIKSLAQKYNNARIIAESTGVGDSLVGDLFRQGLFIQEFRTAGHNKVQLIEKLMIYIEQEKITIPDNKELIEQLEGFEKRISEHGNVQYLAPGRRHDDAVIALALAVQQLGEPLEVKRKNVDNSLEALLGVQNKNKKGRNYNYL